MKKYEVWYLDFPLDLSSHEEKSFEEKSLNDLEQKCRDIYFSLADEEKDRFMNDISRKTKSMTEGLESSGGRRK